MQFIIAAAILYSLGLITGTTIFYIINKKLTAKPKPFSYTLSTSSNGSEAVITPRELTKPTTSTSNTPKQQIDNPPPSVIYLDEKHEQDLEDERNE